MFCFTTAAAILEIRSRLWLWRDPPMRDALSTTTRGLTILLKRAAFSLAITRDWPLMVDGSTEFGWRSLLLRPRRRHRRRPSRRSQKKQKKRRRRNRNPEGRLSKWALRTSRLRQNKRAA